MANPVTHIIVPMLIVETLRRYVFKERFSKWYVFFAGFMGAVADFDVLYTLAKTGSFSTLYHRELTHTLFIPIALGLTGYLIYLLYSRAILKYPGWKISYCLLFLASMSITTHILLDGIDTFEQWFYPLTWTITIQPIIHDRFRLAILDGALMLVWLLYDEELLKDLVKIMKEIFNKFTTKR